MILRTGKALLAMALVLAVTPPVAAQDPGSQIEPETDQSNTRVGTRGATFLEIGIGARAMAMSGAFGAMAQGSEALYWNPAGIAADPAVTAMFSYNDLYGEFGIDHFYGGVTLPAGQGAFGFHIIALTSGDIERTTEEFPEGGDPLFGTTFEWNDIALGVSYARQITDRLNVGATIKWAQSGIDNASANWIGGDAGVTFRTGLLGTTIAATLLNVGTDAKYSGTLIEQIVTDASEVFPTERTLQINLDTRGWDMPTTFGFSVMWDVIGSPEALIAPNPMHNLQVVTDAVDGIDTAVQARIGLEYSYREIVFVRGGKAFYNEEDADFRDFSDGLAGGLGLSVPIGDNHLQLDYAYVDRGLLDEIQTFTVGFVGR